MFWFFQFSLQTNIWLVTDQADVSWPVTIGFVWPSILEYMTSIVSRTPVIIDYHLTLLNTTKVNYELRSGFIFIFISLLIRYIILL
jgi:hypothetical protein